MRRWPQLFGRVALSFLLLAHLFLDHTYGPVKRKKSKNCGEWWHWHGRVAVHVVQSFYDPATMSPFLSIFSFSPSASYALYLVRPIRRKKKIEKDFSLSNFFVGKEIGFTRHFYLSIDGEWTGKSAAAQGHWRVHRQ